LLWDMVSLLWRYGETSLFRQSLPRDYAMSRTGQALGSMPDVRTRPSALRVSSWRDEAGVRRRCHRRSCAALPSMCGGDCSSSAGPRKLRLLAPESLHLIARKQVKRLPSLIVELHAFAGHVRRSCCCRVSEGCSWLGDGRICRAFSKARWFPADPPSRSLL
jgi:hypothetical protein